jgi:tRNA nucleotidyltransferase/poly(A) polymerase
MMQIDLNQFPDDSDAYIVGGTIRDILSDRSPVDYDIVVLRDAEKYANELAAKTAGRLVVIGKSGFSVFRVVTQNLIYDISAAEGRSIEEDLRRRDFTINAMAFHLSTGDLIDCMDSRNDLARKQIRMVSESAFVNDPVRMIRAYRLAAGLEFSIEPKTAAAIELHAKLVSKSAGERIREELLKLLNCPKTHFHLSQMAANGLLGTIIPELNDAGRNISPARPINTLLDHSLNTCSKLEELLDKSEQMVNPKYRQRLQQILDKHFGLLKFATLLHELEKTNAMAFRISDAIRHQRHAGRNAGVIISICRRLRFSNAETDYVDFIIRNQLYPYHLYAAHQKDRLGPRAVSRFYRQCHDNTPGLMMHAMADFSGGQITTHSSETGFIDFAGELLDGYYTDYLPRAALPPVITGNDLSSEFNLKPSPLFKQILAMVEEERLSKETLSRNEALNLVAEFIKKKS